MDYGRISNHRIYIFTTSLVPLNNDYIIKFFDGKNKAVTRFGNICKFDGGIYYCIIVSPSWIPMSTLTVDKIQKSEIIMQSVDE